MCGTVKLTPKHSKKKKKKKSFSMLILFDCNSIIRSGINNYKTIYVDVVTSLYSKYCSYFLSSIWIILTWMKQFFFFFFDTAIFLV
jgi:hypothetical protein